MITADDLSKTYDAIELMHKLDAEIKSLEVFDWKFFLPIFGESYHVVFFKGWRETREEVDAGFSDLTTPSIRLEDLSPELLTLVQDSFDARSVWHDEVYPEEWPEDMSLSWKPLAEGVGRPSVFKAYIQECVVRGQGVIPKFNLKQIFKGVLEHVGSVWSDLMRRKNKEYNSHWRHDWQLSVKLNSHEWSRLELSFKGASHEKKRIKRIASKVNSYFMGLGVDNFGDLRSAMQTIKPSKSGFKTVLAMLQNCEKNREYHEVFLPYVDGILRQWEPKHLTMDSYGKFDNNLVGRYVKVWDLKTLKGCEAFGEGKLPGNFEYVKLTLSFDRMGYLPGYPHLKAVFLDYYVRGLHGPTFKVLRDHPNLEYIGTTDTEAFDNCREDEWQAFFDEKVVYTTNAKLMRKIFG